MLYIIVYSPKTMKFIAYCFFIIPVISFMIFVDGFSPSSSANDSILQRRIRSKDTIALTNPLRGSATSPPISHATQCTALFINFGWFSGRQNENDSDPNNMENLMGAASSAGMGGVASTMDSMENFKQAQRAGKMTRKLVQELASTTVEGSAADGKVKVVLDCQQRPVRVYIDQEYVDEVGVPDLCSAVTSAMSEAYGKSLERMDEKMKNFYTELGLPSTNA